MIVCGDDRELGAVGDDHGGDHEGPGEAEGGFAGDPDIVEHVRGSCEAGGVHPRSTGARQAWEGPRSLFAGTAKSLSETP